MPKGRGALHKQLPAFFAVSLALAAPLLLLQIPNKPKRRQLAPTPPSPPSEVPSVAGSFMAPTPPSPPSVACSVAVIGFDRGVVGERDDRHFEMLARDLGVVLNIPAIV